MDDSTFEDLIQAEKLNVKDFRKLIYQTFPIEPLCECSPIIGCFNSTAKKRKEKPKTSKFIVCRYGCTCRKCSKLHTYNAFNVKSKKVRNRKIIFNSKSISSVVDPTSRFVSPERQRGGGEYGNELDFDFTWYNNNYTRLHGGGCDSKKDGVKWKTGSKMFKFDDATYTAAKLPSKCTRFNTGNALMQPTYFAPNDTLSGTASTKDTEQCTKNPCLGAECFIRAFQETQDFVNNLGKVPGLAGLGLMDPSESPYFGRPRQVLKETTIFDIKRSGPTSTQHTNIRNITSPPMYLEGTKPNTQNGLPESFTTNVPGRTGAVREAVPVLPEPGSFVIPSQRSKKKEDKIDKPKDPEPTQSNSAANVELGPCGAAKCKSRRIKHGSPELTLVTHPTEESESKAAPHAKSGHGSSKADKHSVSRNKSNLAQSGEKKEPDVRKFGNFVYNAGDTYPGMGFGHKSCVHRRKRVPANMGWLWNQADTNSTLKPRTGWKPGSIQSNIKEIMREAKAGFLHGKVRPRSTPSKRRKGTKTKARQSVSYSSVKKIMLKKKETDVKVEEPPPTLHIQRKDGVYYVTMYPIKQETMEIPQLEEPQKPLQFKIVKSRDSLASSTTASDMEIEFSPPAAVNRYKKKPDVIHVSTQVTQQDILNAFKPEKEKKDTDKSGSKKAGKKEKDK